LLDYQRIMLNTRKGKTCKAPSLHRDSFLAKVPGFIQVSM